MSSTSDPQSPRWKEDFPIRSDEDCYATRREFSKFLGLMSVAILVGTTAATFRKWWKKFRASHAPELALAGDHEVAVGGYKLFRYPTESDPCILVRLDEQRYAAFDQRCSHLSCPVFFDSASRQLVCPCHEGFFSAEDGRPLSGPAKRPLAPLSVSVRDGKVWVSISEDLSV
jgi:Rieske Fe-S protein